MPKESKKMLIQNRISTTSRIEEKVLKLRSVKSIVIAPAKTGSDKRSNTAVIFTDHTNRESRSNCIPYHRILIIVVIKLMAPRMEEIPAKWREKIAKSTELPA